MQPSKLAVSQAQRGRRSYVTAVRSKCVSRLIGVVVLYKVEQSWGRTKVGGDSEVRE